MKTALMAHFLPLSKHKSRPPPPPTFPAKAIGHFLTIEQLTRRSAMALKIRTFLLLLLILLIPFSGIVEGFEDGPKPYHSLYKDGNRMKLRKLAELDSLLDYDDAGANPRHDPRRKPGNGGGRNL